MKIFLIILILFIPLFIVRFINSQPKFSVGERIRITTRISQEPYLHDSKQVINISTLHAYLPRFPEFNYGDRIQITGTVQKTDRGLFLQDPEAIILQKHGILPEIRNKITLLFAKTLPNPESALLGGIALGAKEGFTSEFISSLKNAGVLHVVVASGTNVTLVSKMLLGILLIYLSRNLAIPLALSGIWVYVAMIGFEAPIVRAAIMGSLAFVGQELGRVSIAWWGLFLSALVMLLINPNWVTDVGFLLSFTATGGILAFEKKIKNLMNYLILRVTREDRDPDSAQALRALAGREKPEAGPAKIFLSDFSTSLAAQIGVTPILFVAFGQFAPWSPVVNALLLWTIAPIMTLAFLGGVLGLLFEPAGQLIILFAYPFSWLFVKVVELF